MASGRGRPSRRAGPARIAHVRAGGEKCIAPWAWSLWVWDRTSSRSGGPSLVHRGPESARKAEKVGVEDEGGLGAPDDRRVRDRIGGAVVRDDMRPEAAKATRRVRPEGPAMPDHRSMPPLAKLRIQLSMRASASGRQALGTMRPVTDRSPRPGRLVAELLAAYVSSPPGNFT
jgi:hypothetical protein